MAHKGTIPWNKGIARTNKEKENMSIGLKNYYKTSKRKPIGMSGKKHSEEHKKRISTIMKGKNTWMKGRKLTAEWIKNRTLSQSGKNHYNWKGGWSKKYILETREKIAGRKRPDLCEICNKLGKICFDHDHKTGKFRGWICRKCNAVLGLVYEDIETLSNMITYLKNNKNDNS